MKRPAVKQPGRQVSRPAEPLAPLRSVGPAPTRRPPVAGETDVRWWQHEFEVQQAELQAARAQTESLLRKYAELHDFAPVGYFLLDERGLIHDANLLGAQLLGAERARLQRRNLLTFVAPACRPGLQDFLRRVFARSGRHSCELALAGPPGPTRWVGLHGSQEAGAAEAPKRCRLAMSDLAGLRRSDEALRDSESRYRRLFEAAPDGVVLVDPATRKIVDANPFLTRLLGCPRADLLGKELSAVGLMRDRRACGKLFRQLQRGQAIRLEPVPLISRTGRTHMVEVRISLHREGGRPLAQCNVRDITRRHRMECQLRHSEALLGTLIGEAPVGVVVVDAQLELVRANPPAAAAFRNAQPFRGRKFPELLDATWSARAARQVARCLRQTLRTGKPCRLATLECRRRETGARECYDWQIRRVTLPEGESGIMCFFSDTTERTRLEAAGRRAAVLAANNEQLVAEVARRKAVERSLVESHEQQARLLAEARELQSQLRHLSRSVIEVQEEERRLISRELHDVIAQNLTGISLQLGSLETQAGRGQHAFRRCLASTRKLVGQAVETVHDFARELRPSVLDDLGLVPALHTCLRDFAARTGIRVHLVACREAEQLDPALRTVLFRVAQEALTNVARHAAASQVEVRLQPESGGLCLKVSDNGRSFRVGQVLRSKRSRRLGLVGMRERLEIVGGRLELDSAPERGTTVSAHLALAQSPRRPAP